jgi:RHS repeat-associated protein
MWSLHNANGNVSSIQDPLSRTTTQEFDALNRLKVVKDPFNGAGNPTQYSYNHQGVLTQVTDPAGLSTTYTVNGHGETTAQSSPDTGSTSFTFDPASNMLTKLDARSIQATYAYDALNRVTQIVYPDETVTYTWDTCTNGKGRLCSVSDNSGTTTYTLDQWGRVTNKSQNVASLTQSMGYAFNSAGQLATVTTPSGRQVVYTYSNGRPVSVAVGGVSVVITVVYEPFGPNGGWSWGNSSPGTPNTHTRIHDKDYRTTRVTSDLPVSGSQPYFDKQFTWDDQSRITSIADLATSALNSSYGYDALDRVTSASQGAASWGYTFNGIGDRLTSTVGAASTTYGYFSGTHRLQSLSGAQSKSYTFDAAGNLTSDGTTTWVYGGNNRPTQAGATTFLINALGQRVKKSTGGSAVRFIYDEAGRLWGEYDAAGTLIQEIVWLDGLPVAVLRANGAGTDIFYVHPDHLGTPRAITRAADNQFVWKWDNTEPFGNSSPNENPSGLGMFAFNLRFPGQYWDSETGTAYNYHRTYDASIGRYIQSDPIGLHGGLSTYGYVRGNPLGLIDPLGLVPPIGGAGAAGAIGGGGAAAGGGVGWGSQGGRNWNGGDNWNGSWGGGSDGSNVIPFPGKGSGSDAKDKPQSCPTPDNDPWCALTGLAGFSPVPGSYGGLLTCQYRCPTKGIQHLTNYISFTPAEPRYLCVPVRESTFK